jgi:hypothetical protein
VASRLNPREYKIISLENRCTKTDHRIYAQKQITGLQDKESGPCYEERFA